MSCIKDTKKYFRHSFHLTFFKGLEMVAINRKLAHSNLLDSMEDKLANGCYVNGTAFYDSTWKLKRKVHHTVDFSVFSEDFMKFEEGVSVAYGGERFIVSCEELAKIIFLEVTNGKLSISCFSGVRDVIAFLFYFINQEEDNTVNKTNLEEFYSILLTQDIDRSGVHRRISPPQFEYRFGLANLLNIQRILSQLGVEGVLSTITKKQAAKSLNEACKKIMDQTREEYAEGGSFNFLGLDIGKHYIDHCNSIFESQMAYVLTIKHTMYEAYKAWSALEGIDISERTFKRAIAVALGGGDYEDFRKSKVILKNETTESIEAFIHHRIREYFPINQRLSTLLKLQSINHLIDQCDLKMRYDTQEFVRALLLHDFIGESVKSKADIWNEYSSALDKKPDCTLEFFEDAVEELLQKEAVILPSDSKGMRNFLKGKSAEFPSTIYFTTTEGYRFFNTLPYRIAHAGITCLVGLTGWRASEYGYPLSSIKIASNPDPLDNYYSPWRFHLKWKVPKTSGEALLDREITLSCYMISYLLSNLLGEGDDSPILFELGDDSSNERLSNERVTLAVRFWWEDFVKNYSIFNDIDRYEALKDNIGPLSKSQKKQLSSLEADYDFSQSAVKELAKMRLELRADLPAVLQANNRASKDMTLGSMLRRYRDGLLPRDEKRLIDTRLSVETRKKIIDKSFPLTKAAVLTIRGEFLGDAAYPTPHAFRHIWAEAVLRRYRGDVGKFIRANFKHLDERFFMAYLKNKEMKAIKQVATRNVINSIVRQQLKAMEDESREYAGGFDRFLSKAVGVTKVISHSDFERLQDKITNQRVIDMKANPWNTCILRANTEYAAKCSEGGIPQRHNASPTLCLGCLNANVSEGNFNGIVVYTKHDVEVCRNPDVPYWIKEPHIHTVVQAKNRVVELRRNSGNTKYDKFIAHLVETIDIANQSKDAA